MIFEGNHSVIAALKEKKRLMETGQPHDHIKPILVIDGGLMKGAYGLGACMALDELGYRDVFDAVVGISSGAPTAAYFIAGQVHEGSPILWDVFCSKHLINFWRFWNQVNTEYVMRAIRDVEPYKLKDEDMFRAGTDLYFGVANFETGKPTLIKPTDKDSLFASMHASILMPNVSNSSVTLDKIRYADGGFTSPHVLTKVVEEIEATHILLITNQDHIDKVVPDIPFIERFLNHTVYRWRMPKLLRFAAHERWKERLRVIRALQSHSTIKLALVWGNRAIKSMEQDPALVRTVVEKSRQWWLELMTKDHAKKQ